MIRFGGWAVLLALGTLAVSQSACTRKVSMPKPEAVLDAYADALARGDVEAVWALMSDESKRAMSKDELKKIISDQKVELSEQSASLAAAERVVKTRARIRYDDGEVVTLDLEEDGFRVAAADALPAAAKTPAQALGQLRRVLARRSYVGMLRVLSPEARAEVEQGLRSLVEGLNEPDALQITLEGDTAKVSVPGGHEVKLRREDGVWRIDDFN